MSPTKVSGLVLRMLPYQESSSILHVYTEELGLLHGVAKGIRRRTKRTVPLERGALVEMLAWVRPRQSLHTVGSIEVLDYFPSIRSDLVRTAMRDAAFETALKSLHPEEPNPELFAALSRLMADLERARLCHLVPHRLWRFYVALAQSLGFGLDLDTCLSCGNPLADADGGLLVIDRGGLTCARCAGPAGAKALLSRDIIALMRDSGAAHATHPLHVDQQRSVTRLLARYCYHHADVREDNRALDFLCGLLGVSGDV